MYVLDLQKTHNSTQRIELLENESAMAQIIAQLKENIWIDINEAMTEIFPAIEIIFE